jgi:hypothetical protein
MEAVSPLIFSALLDARDAYFMMWFAITCSVLAAAVNVPLMREPQLGAIAFRAKMATGDTPNDDNDLQPEIDPGSQDGGLIEGWMPLRELEKRNLALLAEGKPPIHLKYGKYDPAELGKIKARAALDFEEITDMASDWLLKTKDVEDRKKFVQLQDVYLKVVPPPPIIRHTSPTNSV